MRNLLAFTLMVIFFIPACATENFRTLIADNERVKPEPILPMMVIEWKHFKTAREVHKACIEAGVEVEKGDELLGCAIYDRENLHCIIYAQVPKYVDGDERMDTLGHEVLHCFAGDFHKE